MTLQFRRGTDAERQTITPAAGEPIWTTDTTQLYVGDGITPGGVAVGSGGGSISTITNQALFTTSSVEFANLTIQNDGTIYASQGTYGPPDGTFAPVRVGLYGNEADYAIGVEGNHSWIQGNTGVKLYSGDNNERLAATTAGVRINTAYTLPTVDGTEGQVAITNGAGTVSFGTVSTANITGLATVATSGSYTDLSNQPTNQDLFTNSNVTFGTVTLNGLQVAQINTAPGLSNIETNGNFAPSTDKADSLGEPGKHWATLYVNTVSVDTSIVFGDNTVQTTAYTGASNPFDQTLNTTSSVAFNSVKVGPDPLHSSDYFNIITDNPNDIDIYTNGYYGGSSEVWLRHNASVDIITDNGGYTWSFDNTGTLHFPDGSTQTTAYTGGGGGAGVYTGYRDFLVNPGTLTAAQTGTAIQLFGADVELPLGTDVAAGGAFVFTNEDTTIQLINVATGSSDFIYHLELNTASLEIWAGETVELTSRGSGEWDITGGTLGLRYQTTASVQQLSIPVSGVITPNNGRVSNAYPNGAAADAADLVTDTSANAKSFSIKTQDYVNNGNWWADTPETAWRFMPNGYMVFPNGVKSVPGAAGPWINGSYGSLNIGDAPAVWDTSTHAGVTILSGPGGTVGTAGISASPTGVISQATWDAGDRTNASQIISGQDQPNNFVHTTNWFDNNTYEYWSLDLLTQNTATTVIQTTNGVSTSTWTFDSTGGLSAPGEITMASLVLSSSTATLAGDNQQTPIPGSGSNSPFGSVKLDIQTDSADFLIQTHRASDGANADKTFVFTRGGALVLPNGAYILDQPGLTSFTANSGNYMSFATPDNNTYVEYDTNGVYLYTDYNNAAYTWTFNNSGTTTLPGLMTLAVYTAAQLTAITGTVGQMACVSDSAAGGNPNGMMAFWDTTHSRWSYIHDNSAV